jgi:hypothetical protein
MTTLLCATLWQTALRAQTQPSSEEYHVKAGFLFHFGEMATWPAASPNRQAFNLCTLGDDPFRGELESSVEGKPIGSLPIRVRHFKQAKDTHACQMLFISAGEDPRLPGIFADLGNAPVMTVGESDDFLTAGGMVRFCIESNRVRFEINLRAADHAGLKFSSQLLLLARTVLGRAS